MKTGLDFTAAVGYPMPAELKRFSTGQDPKADQTDTHHQTLQALKQERAHVPHSSD